MWGGGICGEGQEGGVWNTVVSLLGTGGFSGVLRGSGVSRIHCSVAGYVIVTGPSKANGAGKVDSVKNHGTSNK
jgi:hypothetical protein